VSQRLVVTGCPVIHVKQNKHKVVHKILWEWNRFTALLECNSCSENTPESGSYLRLRALCTGPGSDPSGMSYADGSGWTDCTGFRCRRASGLRHRPRSSSRAGSPRGDPGCDRGCSPCPAYCTVLCGIGSYREV